MDFQDNNEVIVVEDSDVEVEVEFEVEAAVEVDAGPVEPENSIPVPSNPTSPAPPENADPLPAADGLTEEVREILKNTGLVIGRNKMTKPVRMPLERGDPLQAVPAAHGNIVRLATFISSDGTEYLFVGFENDVVEVYKDEKLIARLASYDPGYLTNIISINYCEGLAMVVVQVKRVGGGSLFRFYDMLGKRYLDGVTIPACGSFNAAYSRHLCYEQEMVSFHPSSGLFVHCPSAFLVTVYQARQSNHTNMKTFVVDRKSKFPIEPEITIKGVSVLLDGTILFLVSTFNQRAVTGSKGMYMLQTTLDGIPLSFFRIPGGFSSDLSVTVTCSHIGVLIRCTMQSIGNRLRIKTLDLTGAVVEENVVEKQTPFRHFHFYDHHNNHDRTVQCSTTLDARNTPFPFRVGGGVHVYEHDTKLLFPVFNSRPDQKRDVAGVRTDLCCHLDHTSLVAMFGGKTYYTTQDGLFCMYPQPVEAEKPKWTELFPELATQPPAGFSQDAIERMTPEQKFRYNLPKHPQFAFPLISSVGGYRREWTDRTNYLYHRSIRKQIFYIFMCNERLKTMPGRRFLPQLCLFDVFRELVDCLVTPRCVRKKTLALQ